MAVTAALLGMDSLQVDAVPPVQTRGMDYHKTLTDLPERHFHGNFFKYSEADTWLEEGPFF